MSVPTGFLMMAKRHLRVEGTDEDVILGFYAEAAIDYVHAFTGREWLYWPDGEGHPAGVLVAAMLLVADMYENREAQSTVKLSENKTVERLLWPYRVF